MYSFDRKSAKLTIQMEKEKYYTFLDEKVFEHQSKFVQKNKETIFDMIETHIEKNVCDKLIITNKKMTSVKIALHMGVIDESFDVPIKLYVEKTAMEKEIEVLKKKISTLESRQPKTYVLYEYKYEKDDIEFYRDYYEGRYLYKNGKEQARYAALSNILRMDSVMYYKYGTGDSMGRNKESMGSYFVQKLNPLIMEIHTHKIYIYGHMHVNGVKLPKNIIKKIYRITKRIMMTPEEIYIHCGKDSCTNEGKIKIHSMDQISKSGDNRKVMGNIWEKFFLDRKESMHVEIDATIWI